MSSDSIASDTNRQPIGTIREVGRAFLKLGLTCFGGPIAHIGYFHTEFVHKRRWLHDTEYADLVALCQFLPGPASSQVAFALGFRRAGLLGAVVASLAFLLPSAVIMIAFAYGLSYLPTTEHARWIHGLKLAAVAVVAQAVINMWCRLCPDWPRALVALFAAAALFFLPGATPQLAIIASGAAFGWLFLRNTVAVAPSTPTTSPRERAWGAVALAGFTLLLALSMSSGALRDFRDLHVFSAFYRSGALVFGGGHVVLPLLRSQVVPNGWVSDESFLTGYGAAQAVPGPLFSFAGYLGAIIFPGHWAWAGGLWCLLAVFLPAWLLVAGTIPFWYRLRATAWAPPALAGANAAVVGILLAALRTPLIDRSIHRPIDAAIACLALALLQVVKAPPILVVMLSATLATLVAPAT